MIKTITKRSLIMLLVAWITFISIFSAYQQTTDAAEYIAGTVAAIGGAPLLTALLIGGVVVAGGVALYELSQTDAEDYTNFATGIKNGFMEFVSDQEKQIALENNQSLTDQEAADIGVANARNVVNGFWNGAVDTVKNTTQNITFNAYKYWDLYSRIIADVADNGISNGGDITANTTIVNNIHNDTAFNFKTIGKSNIGSNTREINGDYYITRGQYKFSDGIVPVEYSTSSNTTQKVPFIVYYTAIDGARWWVQARFNVATINLTDMTTTVELRANSSVNDVRDSVITTINNWIDNTDIPVFVIQEGTGKYTEFINSVKADPTKLKVGSGESEKVWKRTINTALTDNTLGQAIKTGRRSIVNNGDWIGSIFQEDSVPVKKTGINVLDGVVSGKVGWDIPSARTWDDVFLGSKPYADVVGQTGAIGVPDDVVTGTKDDGRTVEYPDDATVQDTADYPKEGTDDPAIDNDKPQEIPEKPQQEVFEDQGGTFYPNMMDLTNIFPFCIPFDVIYIIEKFDQGQEEAPVLTIPIVYPSAIQSAMGSSGYEVVIDFEDFIVLRNILRVFILLLFIAGLMKITRDLIRG